MLQYKPVTVERLICTCDRCGKTIDQETDVMEWQERFVISYRAGFGSVFGDGNIVEADFCQDCIKSVLGKWIRVVQDDPFEHQKKPTSYSSKLLQPYQQKIQDEAVRMNKELTDIFKGSDERSEKRKQLAERLDISSSLVDMVAIDHLLAATEHLAKKEENKE